MGVPSDQVRVGARYLILEFKEGTDAAFKDEAKQFIAKWGTVTRQWQAFFVGDDIRVVLGTDTSKKREYNNRLGKITAPFAEKRFPIEIDINGTRKNLKV